MQWKLLGINQTAGVTLWAKKVFYFQFTSDVGGETSRVSGDKQLQLLVQVAVDKVCVPRADPCEKKNKDGKKK